MSKRRFTATLIMLASTGGSLWLASCAWLEPELRPGSPYGSTILPARFLAPPSGALSAETVPVGSEGPLELTIREAGLLCLEQNRAFRVERYKPSIAQTAEDLERAAFDPTLSGAASWSRRRGPEETITGTTYDTTTTESLAKAEVRELLPTGTELRAGLSTQHVWTNQGRDLHSTRAGLSITQALLRGGSLEANLARLRQARLDTIASEYELRGFAEALIAELESAYWDYALAQKQVAIYEESARLAQRQLEETEARVQIGKLPQIELAAARAEVALRNEDLINARSVAQTARLRLLRALSPPGAAAWDRPLVLRDQPLIPDELLESPEAHVQVALRMRPDLNQARLAARRGELEVVRTKNGLLPRLDFFLTLGKTGYADTFGGSVNDLDGHGYDLLAGFNFEYTLANRAARAAHRRAVLTRQQAQEAVQNLAQLVEMDVRTAYIEVERTREQVAATAATRQYQEETLRAETEKAKVGKSTSFLVARAQRDLVASQIAEVQAVVNHLKALIQFYRLEGSLLSRRGIDAPGSVPPDMAF